MPRAEAEVCTFGPGNTSTQHTVLSSAPGAGPSWAVLTLLQAVVWGLLGLLESVGNVASPVF